MIYSKKNDFLFLKGKKVAGTSVEMALSVVCGPDDIITPITPVDELERIRLGGRGAQLYSVNRAAEAAYLEKLISCPASELGELRPPQRIYKAHMSLRDFSRLFGCIPTERIFCVERSPYAKIISGRNMSLNFDAYKRDGGKMELDPDRLRESLSGWFERNRWFERRRNSVHRNVNRYRDPEGTLRLRVLRFESLEEDFARLMTEYGISPLPKLPHAKKGANASTLDPRELFTREQLDDINEAYAEEFDAFGHERL